MYKRFEVEKMNETQIKGIALKQFSYCGFDNYIVECDNGTMPEYKLITFYEGKYIDYVAYPDYVERVPHDLEAYYEWCIKHCKDKLYSVSDLCEFSTYKEFDARRDFLHNIYSQTYKTRYSAFSQELTEEMAKGMYYYCFNYFKDENEMQDFKQLKHKIYEAYRTRMEQDNEFFKNACIWEMFNHESAIDWDGYEPALDALGIKYKNLSKEKQSLVDEAFSYVCRHTNC